MSLTVPKRHKNGGKNRIVGVSEYHGPATAIVDRAGHERIAPCEP